MTYNIGEKPAEGSYLCPNCGYGAGEMTMLARREVTSVGTDLIPPGRDVSAAHAWKGANNVKSLRTHFAKLKLVTLTLVLAGVMFLSGFATKALLSTGAPNESPSAGPSTIPRAGEPSQNVNRGNAGVNSAGASVSAGNPSVTVWVNTNSGVYHCANTRWYGNTKSGQYMTQQEAQSKGYRPAHGSACG
jgi:hypothetical protein